MTQNLHRDFQPAGFKPVPRPRVEPQPTQDIFDKLLLVSLV
jgi:hypothetical protein